MIPTLHINLLGGFRLVSGETSVNGTDLPRLQSLLAYLLLHSGVPQSRSHLAFLFWPDSTDSQAHANLRNVIHKLRQALPNADTFLQADRQTLHWKPNTQDTPWILDVLDFKTAIAHADQARDAGAASQALMKAVKLYQGDLLPSCYDEWILPERDRLHQMFLKTLERLIELQEQERDYDAAIVTAQRLLRHDPLHEATYRQLMRLYAVSGDRAAALRIYHTCSTVLERELATQPGKATRAIYERLLQAEGAPQEQKTPQPTLVAAAPLVGRQLEWAQLQAVWRNSVAGRPHLLLISGEAGIGKTRLAEELLTWIGRQGIATSIARCYAAEGRLGYGPIATMTELLEKIRPVVLQRGNPTQRAQLFYSSALMSAKRNRFVISPEMLADADAGLAAYEKLGNLVNMGWGHFIIGAFHLIRDSLTEAERELQVALTIGERTGGAILRLQCLSYLVLLGRKRGQVEDVRCTAQRALEMASTMHLPDYIGLNKANLAWVACREEKLSEAWEHGQAALATWHSVPAGYPFHWTALLPLIDIALARDQISEAVDCARLLLAPEQQQLLEALSENLEAAVQAWDAGQPDSARTHLQQAIVLARER